jgi:hypothetical protein
MFITAFTKYNVRYRDHSIVSCVTWIESTVFNAETSSAIFYFGRMGCAITMLSVYSSHELLYALTNV